MSNSFNFTRTSELGEKKDDLRGRSETCECNQFGYRV